MNDSPSFFSRERLLRGVVAPWEGAAMVILASACGSAIRSEEGGWWEPLAAILLGLAIGCMTLAALVDSVTRFLPDPLLGAALLCSLGGRALDSGFLESCAWAASLYTAMRFLSERTSLGGGDAKLLALMLLLFGDPLIFLAAVGIGAAGAGVYSVCLILSCRASPSSAIALGPWLMVGCWCMWAAPWLIAAFPCRIA